EWSLGSVGLGGRGSEGRRDGYVVRHAARVQAEPSGRGCERGARGRMRGAPERVLPPAKKVGEVAERPKAHAWKACTRKRIVGSNPTLSANVVPGAPHRRCGFAPAVLMFGV